MDNSENFFFKKDLVLQVVVGVLMNTSFEVLMTKRDFSLDQGGLWEFPGGKVEPSETLENALKREFHEEIDIDVRECQLLMSVVHAYPEKNVQLHVYLITHYLGVPKICDGQLAMKWVALSTWNNHETPVPASNIPIIETLKQTYSRRL